MMKHWTAAKVDPVLPHDMRRASRWHRRVFPTPGPTDEEVKELEVKNEQKAAERAVKNAQKATGRNEAKERRKANKVAHQYGSRPSLASTLHLPFGKK